MTKEDTILNIAISGLELLKLRLREIMKSKDWDRLDNVDGNIDLLIESLEKWRD